jgi:hypothetical protein
VGVYAIIAPCHLPTVRCFLPSLQPVASQAPANRKPLLSSCVSHLPHCCQTAATALLRCSLNPGVDRLAFSVVWDMDAEANIL